VKDEILVAVQKGYKIVEMHEVHEYQVTTNKPQTGHCGLFVEYINTFLKFKAEASGYPNWVQCPDDEDQYINEFHKSEVIQRDKDAIAPNPAKLGLAKFCLNSMRGELTERNNRTRTKMITNPQELYRFLATPDIEVATMVFADDDVVCASWRYIAEEKVPNLRHTSEVILTYVTAGARIHLYKYLDRLQQKLYIATQTLLFAFNVMTNQFSLIRETVLD
jgi:hypothetical protein